MKIFTADQIRELDRKTIENEGVTSLQLIERTAEGVVVEVVSRIKANSRIAIFAGPGNNGADALVVASMLYDQGYKPEVFLLNIGGDRLSADCLTCRDRLLQQWPEADFTEVVKQFNRPHLDRNYIVVDGLFGTGLREPLAGGFRELVKFISDSGATVISIDIPSGLSADWNPNTVARNTIHATVTLGVQFPHLSFLMAENAEIIGQWKTIDIGLSATEIRRTPAPFYYLERTDVKRMLRPRRPFASKADFGSAMLVTGSYGMMGAAVLSARGALRAGVGKLTVFSPRCGYETMQTSVPEAMFAASNADLTIGEIHASHPYDAIGIGPGIGTSEATTNALERFLTLYDRPLVLDADALNCLARRQTLLNHVPTHSILTPHAVEFDRLFGQHANSEARLVKAIEMARFHNVIIVLKGRYTAIVRPDGNIYFNSTGTPAMATPGAGDVLTGVITGFLAQGYSPEVAALLGVYVHGLAGQLAAEVEGSYGVTAGDIAANVGRAIKTIMS
ncbi:MAG: NAD(P)H-hydrate dehydratase [Bacteroides sp.]|nr:NAD(P)H-hydrate dehydratase [Bacteroides sp.]MCM1379617.1 NAD(P)H-hydrate dehydratase [Bacteroides sp.]MCM1446001.1 NAD(P)H-hydrate dehydratase [Prevotella sp.]